MPIDQLSLTFSALADPTRRAILTQLMAGETSATKLGAPFAMTAPAITKHLKVLEGAGLIARSRRAQWRPCKLDAAPLREVAEWIEPYRRFWNERLDGMSAYLEHLQAKEKANDT